MKRKGVPADSPIFVIPSLTPKTAREELPLVLERNQWRRQSTQYLQDFIYDCLQNDKIESDRSLNSGLLLVAWELCNQERKCSLCKDIIVSRIHPPAT